MCSIQDGSWMPTPYPMLEETNLSFLCQQAIAADNFAENLSEERERFYTPLTM